MTTDVHQQLEKILNSDNATTSVDEDGEEQIEYKELVPVEYEERKTSLTLTENGDLNDDYRFARSNLYGLIGRSNAALDLVLRIAAMSEHPRALEVAANLMKTSSDMTKDLLELQKKIEKSQKENDTGGSTYQTQINNYYGKETDEPNKNNVKDVDRVLDSLDDLDNLDDSDET